MAISRLSIIKFLEMLLTIVCIGLHYHSFANHNLAEQMLVTGTFVGYFIVLIGGFAGHLMQSPINKRIDIFYCLLGCALFVASGALCIQYFENMTRGDFRNKGLAKASIAIINGGLFLLDSLLTWRGEY